MLGPAPLKVAVWWFLTFFSYLFIFLFFPQECSDIRVWGSQIAQGEKWQNGMPGPGEERAELGAARGGFPASRAPQSTHKLAALPSSKLLNPARAPGRPSLSVGKAEEGAGGREKNKI